MRIEDYTNPKTYMQNNDKTTAKIPHVHIEKRYSISRGTARMLAAIGLFAFALMLPLPVQMMWTLSLCALLLWLWGATTANVQIIECRREVAEHE